MLVTRNHQLNIQSVHWDIAHIYEHMLIVGARKYLCSKGVNIDLFGWISGETFEDWLFIEAGFYREEVAEIFDRYMKAKTHFSDSDIEYAISVVELEEKGRFKKSIATIKPELNKIVDLAWGVQTSSEDRKSQHQSLFKPAKSDFVDVSIDVVSARLSHDDQKVMLRLHILLMDIINNYISNNLLIYENNVGDMCYSADRAEFNINLTMNKSHEPIFGDFKDRLIKHINNYPVDDLWSDFQAHFDEFAAQPMWKKFSTEYYRDSGIVTTTEEICRLASQDRVYRLFSQIELEIHTAN